jgi:hypothetical protein
VLLLIDAPVKQLQDYADLNDMMTMRSQEPGSKAPTAEGLNPEDYPDIHKMAILADVAPYSREYNTFRQIVGKQAQGNTELEIQYEKILTRVKKTRESVIRMNDRHFTNPVEEIAGTVDEVSPGGITLKEFPGRRFQFSSVSTSAADMSARILGENQVSPSLRTQRTSRARQAKAPSNHPCLAFLLALSFSTVECKLDGLSILPETKTLARARQAGTPP